MKLVENFQCLGRIPVSYTHLDVYKRQARIYYAHRQRVYKRHDNIKILPVGKPPIYKEREDVYKRQVEYIKTA